MICKVNTLCSLRNTVLLVGNYIFVIIYVIIMTFSYRVKDAHGHPEKSACFLFLYVPNLTYYLYKIIYYRDDDNYITITEILHNFIIGIGCSYNSKSSTLKGCF